MFNLTIDNLDTTIIVSEIGVMAIVSVALIGKKVFFRQPRLVMSIAVADSIRSLAQGNEEAMFSGIDFTMQIFEQLYNSEDAQISKEDLYRDVERMLIVAERIRQAEDVNQKSKIYYSDYKSLSDELKAKYKEFLPDDAFSEIESKERYMDALRTMMASAMFMLQAFEEEREPVAQADKLYSGMVRLSMLLDLHPSDLPNHCFEFIRTMASALLDDVSLQPNELKQPIELFASLTALRQTSRGVLWQIEEHRKNLEGKSATVGSILGYLKSAPKWEGDDFEECLKDVNDARR